MLSIQKVFRQNHDLHCFTISRLVQKQWTESISEKQSCFVALPFWQARKTIASTQLQNSMLKTSVSEKSNQRNQIAYMPPVFQNDRNLYNHITTTTNKKTLDLFCLKISILCWTQVFIPYKSNPNSIRFLLSKTGVLGIQRPGAVGIQDAEERLTFLASSLFLPRRKIEIESLWLGSGFSWVF